MTLTMRDVREIKEFSGNYGSNSELCDIIIRMQEALKWYASGIENMADHMRTGENEEGERYVDIELMYFERAREALLKEE